MKVETAKKAAELLVSIDSAENALRDFETYAEEDFLVESGGVVWGDHVLNPESLNKGLKELVRKNLKGDLVVLRKDLKDLK